MEYQGSLNSHVWLHVLRFGVLSSKKEKFIITSNPSQHSRCLDYINMILTRLFCIILTVEIVIAVNEYLSVSPWKLTPSHGSAPEARSGCVAVSSEMEDLFYVFSGFNEKEALRDTYVFNSSRLVWTRLETEGPRRVGSCGWGSTTSNNTLEKIIQYGGGHGSLLKSDLWVFEKGWWKEVRLSSTTLPPPRTRSACFGSSSDTIAGFFGGEGLSGPLSDTWLVNKTTNEFIRVTTTGTPPPVTGASAVYDISSNSVYVFGGVSAEGNFSSELHQLNLTTNSWSVVTVSGSLPSGRSGHVFHIIGDVLLLAAGWESQNEYLHDVWIFNISSSKWMKSQSVSDLGERSCSAVHKDRIWVFGGKLDEGNATSRLVTVSSMGVVELVHKNFIVPSPRSDHSATVHGSDMIIFGGTDSSSCDSIFSDTWSYDLNSLIWKELIFEIRPPPRFGHSAVLIPDGLLIFGGKSLRNYLSDIWVYDFTYDNWSEMTCEGSAPSARSHSGMVYLESYSIFLYGGETGTTPLMDLWSLDVRSCLWERVSGVNTLLRNGGPGTLNRFSMTSDRTGFYIIGGRGPSLHGSDGIFYYDVSTKTWKPPSSSQLTLSTPVESHTSISSHVGILTIGGNYEGLMTTSSLVQFSSPGVNISSTSPIIFEGVSGHTTVLHEGALIIFGGVKRTKSDELSSRFVTSEVFRINISQELTKPWGCGAGSIYSQSRRKCESCPPGTTFQLTSSGNETCIPCPTGLFNPHYGAINVSSCIPCSHGTYTGVIGSSICQDCPVGMLCRLASKEPLNPSVVTRRSLHSTLPNLQTKTPLHSIHVTTIILLSATAGFSLLVIGVFFTGLIPDYYWKKFDVLMAERHRFPEGSFTQRIVTSHGGAISIVVLSVSIAMTTGLLFPVLWAGEYNWATYSPLFLSGENHISTEWTVSITVTGVELSGCVDGAMCAPGIEVSIANMTEQEQSTTRCRFQDNKCEIQYSCTALVIEKISAIRFLMARSEVISPQIDWLVMTISGSPGSASQVGGSISSQEGNLFRGLHPASNTTIIATPTETLKSFKSTSWVGYHLEFESHSLGSQVSNLNYHFKTGLSFRLKIIKNDKSQKVLVERYEVPVVVAAVCIGLFSGLLEIAAMLVALYEYIFFRNTVYGKRRRNFGYIPELCLDRLSTHSDAPRIQSVQQAFKPLDSLFQLPTSTHTPLVDITDEIHNIDGLVDSSGM